MSLPTTNPLSIDNSRTSNSSTRSDGSILRISAGMNVENSDFGLKLRSVSNALSDDPVQETMKNLKKLSRLADDSMQSFKMGAFANIYAEWESEFHIFDEDEEKCGFFAPKSLPGQFVRPKGLLDALYRVFVHFELFICCGTNKTLYDVMILPICVFFSRRISGVFGTKALQIEGFGKQGFKATGLYGWGKKIMLDKGSAKDNFISEVQNLSIVSALFITVVLPLVVQPPDCVMQAPISQQGAYVFISGAALIGQIATAVVSLAILTNLNKCVGEDAGPLYIMSLFNPYNGITGTIGPLLYCGGIFSWYMTILTVVLIVCLNYGNYGSDDSHTKESGIKFSSLFVILAGVLMFTYLFVLIYGTVTEVRCSKPVMNTYKKMTLKEIKLLLEENNKNNKDASDAV